MEKYNIDISAKIIYELFKNDFYDGIQKQLKQEFMEQIKIMQIVTKLHSGY